MLPEHTCDGLDKPRTIHVISPREIPYNKNKIIKN